VIGWQLREHGSGVDESFTEVAGALGSLLSLPEVRLGCRAGKAQRHGRISSTPVSLDLY